MTRTKRKLRNAVTVLMITMLTGSFALAQPGGQQGPPPVPNNKQITKMVKSLDKELDLSDEQAEQVSELYFAHFDTVEAKMKSKQRPSREEMKALDSKLEKEVKALLSKDQKKLYTTWLKEQEQKRSSQRPQGGGNGQHGGGQGPRR
jgi:hypothetical protein